MKEPNQELKIYVALAVEKGYLRFGHTKNAGGWVKVAQACGATGRIGKGKARSYLRDFFSGKTPRRVSVTPKPRINANSDAFLQSFEWRKVRMQALKKYGARCQCCGAGTEHGVMLHVDHIKPRRLFPNLALDLDNLQILCEVCNHGKGNWDMTDWRPEEPIEEQYLRHLREI